MINKWLGRKDLNPHLTEPESVVLPLDHSPAGIDDCSLGVRVSQLLVVGMVVFSFQFSVFSYQFSVFSYQWSVVSGQFVPVGALKIVWLLFSQWGGKDLRDSL